MKINLRRLTLVIIDIITIFISYVLAEIILRQLGVPTLSFKQSYASVFLLMFCDLIWLVACRVYSNIWRYAQIRDFLKCFVGLSGGFLCTYFLCDFIEVTFGYTPHSNIVLDFTFLISLCGIVILRTAYSWIYDYLKHRYSNSAAKIPTLIVGAGLAAHKMVSEMREITCAYSPVAIVDDDSQKQNTYINNVKVMGYTRDIPRICAEHKIKSILVAIPSLNGKERKRILDICVQNVP